MAKKTGKTIVKTRQQMRAAKLARYKRELVEAGVDLSLPKPSMQARREKDEELKRLYLELLSKKAEESEREKSAEQLLTQEQREEEPSQERKEPKPPAEKPTEESEQGD